MAFGTENKVNYKYVITSVKIQIPEMATIDVPSGCINNFLIEKDFETDMYPIFHLNLKLTQKNIYDILENKTTVRFFIHLQSYGYSVGENSEFRYLETVFNESFGIYIDDNSAQIDKVAYETNLALNGGNTSMTDMRTNYDFFLFKDKDLAAGKTIVNKVIKDVDMTGVLTYLLSQSGSKKVLMSKLDNDNVYDEVTLLPINTIQNIRYLDRQYGFYNHGAMLFFDLDRTYMIDKRGEATAYEEDEYTEVILYCFSQSNALALGGGCHVDESTRRYSVNIPFTSIELTTKSVIDDQLVSTNITTLNPKDDISDDIYPEVQHRGKGTKRVIVNNFGNQYANRELEYRKAEADSIIQITFAAVSMNMLTPNKRFILVFEDGAVQARLGGAYRLLGTTFNFKSEADEFSSTSTGVFVKIN